MSISELHLIHLAGQLIDQIAQLAVTDKPYQQIVQCTKEGFPGNSNWKIEEFCSICEQFV
jgi:hypothetical protein